MRHVEALVARLLFWGGVIGIALMALGLAGYALRGGHGDTVGGNWALEQRGPERSAAVFVSLDQVRRGLRQRPMDPLAVAAMGILALMLTPVAGVALAAVSFWLTGDRRYTAIALMVLATLILSLALSAGG